ncbi:conjugation protein [Halococcus salifodinae DSM 8989]|uniref:Conjugation protein n=1 Tax=Halococcus salifodinae DSM 8989 TaxID=1227456 RepID=M0MUZ7_9EURY|nr:conjugation protein [Halococcus salifodinae DSM 8989]
MAVVADRATALNVTEKVHDYYTGAAEKAKNNDDIAQADEARKEYRPPGQDLIVESAHSRTELIEVTNAKKPTEARLCLSEEGEEVIANDTGDVPSSGGEAHDSALETIEHELAAEGFLVNVLEQDGSDMPDATATHPDLDTTLVLEAETTTPTKPPKVLENLKKAQEMNGTPVFVVEPGADGVGVNEAGEDFEYWARRLENILTQPVKKTEDETGIIHYYVSDYLVRINDKASVVRPTTGDKRRTNWTREDGELVMRDGDGTVHTRLENLDDVGISNVPAVDIYDEHRDKHTIERKVEENLTYEDSDNLEEDWVAMKRPAIPEEILPNPEYDRDDYHILIMSENKEERPVFYRDGATFPLSPEPDDPTDTFEKSVDHSASEDENENSSFDGEQPVNDPTDQAGSEPAVEMANDETSNKSGTGTDDSMSDDSDVEETPDEELGGKDEGVAAFADEQLITSENTETPLDEIYDPYKTYANENLFEIRNKRQFATSLRKALDFDFESKRKRVDGSKTTVYIGVGLASP